MTTNRLRKYSFPPHVIDAWELEASNRIKVLNMEGTKMKGSMVRDMLCVAMMFGKSFAEMKRMPPEEFNRLCKEATA